VIPVSIMLRLTQPSSDRGAVGPAERRPWMPGGQARRSLRSDRPVGARQATAAPRIRPNRQTRRISTRAFDRFARSDREPILGGVPRVIEFEFSPTELAQRIVCGALERDPVRLHGAIVAALEIHGLDVAERDVFAPARAAAAAFPGDSRRTVAHAIDAHTRRGAGTTP
jgi:hypothetical protein